MIDASIIVFSMQFIANAEGWARKFSLKNTIFCNKSNATSFELDQIGLVYELLI